MRYHVTLPSTGGSTGGGAAAPVVVDLVERPDGTWQAHVDGREVDLDVAAAGPQLSVRIDGRVIDLTAQGRLPNLQVVAAGMRAGVRVESERTRSADRARAPRAARGGVLVVKSPMPGRVVRVLAAKGDRVEAGQGLLVLEAMKMENEVRAALAGTVVDVWVSAGAAVEAGGHLLTLATRADRDP